MNFTEDKAIYLQIVDYIEEQILSGRWKEGEKIVSVRELASALEVNANTVMRSYTELSENEILVNKRGVGYFVADAATETIRNVRKEHFLQVELKTLFKKMKLLHVSLQDVIEKYQLTENK